MTLASSRTPDVPPLQSPPARDVDVDPAEEETRKRLRRSAAANTVMTGELLESPTLMSPTL